MRCTYVVFEGVFKEEQAQRGRKRLYSTAMIPTTDSVEAHRILVSELDEYGIDFVKIEDRFIFDPSEVDFDDPENRLWISLHDEVIKFRKIIFTPWQIFYE